jgi:hypothetical protein
MQFNYFVEKKKGGGEVLKTFLRRSAMSYAPSTIKFRAIHIPVFPFTIAIYLELVNKDHHS